MATERKYISTDRLLYYHAGLKKLFATQQGLSDLTTIVNGKADAATTLAGYGITDAMTATAISQAIADAIKNKADNATTLAGYGITDAMTATQINEAIQAATEALDTGVISVNGKTGEVTITLDELGGATSSALEALAKRVDDIVAEGGEPNIIDTVKVNGTALTVTDKAVDITVPTDNASLTNGAGYQTASDVSTAISGKADKTEIPTNNNQLTNGAGYQTASDVSSAISNKADKSEIPTNNNQLTNGAGYQTASDVSSAISGKADSATTLAGYGITDAMTETEINQAIADAIGDVTSFEFEVVTSLPTTGAKGTMYLVLMTTTENQNIYEEFIYVNDGWEKLGTLGVDLSGYMKTTDMVEATEPEIDTILNS